MPWDLAWGRSLSSTPRCNASCHKAGSECNRSQNRWQPEPKAGEPSRRQRTGQRDRKRAGCLHADSANFMAVCIECRRNAGVGRAQQGQPLLDGAHACRREVLARAGRVAEPGIVGDVHQPSRAVGPIDDLAAEDRLIADQRSEWRQARDVEGARPGAPGRIRCPAGP